MYNKKSKASAILLIITAVLLVGLMILFPFLQPHIEDSSDASEGIGAAFGVLFFIIGCFPLYAGAVSFVIVASVFGIKMLKQQLRSKLISYNVRQLIATCVLLPFIAVGLIICSALFANSTLGIFPIIYVIIVALAYVASLITQIVTIPLLKKMPEQEVVLPVVEQ